ncbi:MAG: hypothetical protein JETCAE01_06240 [Anaerolineaceae bacterium]|nr:MAG: hypothetical protein EDM79_17050 [Chloroflexota bacterium]GJQ34614.1 MAG: hypothetical protein JETCAE01_06240 [Anaerolineaceae bacterium]
MKKYSNLFLVLAALTAMLISACGGAAAGTETSAGSGKPLASLVEFTGVIEAIDGNQWTVNGQVITVEPSVLRDGPFEVGDTVKIEAEVQADGSLVVTRVEPPAGDNANTNDDNTNSGLGNSNGNSNGNDNANANGNSNSNGNSNDDNSNGNSNDDNSNDDNSNDDNSNDDNSNDDNSNGSSNDDDNSGSGGNDNGDDDNSGSGGGDDDD